MMAAKPTYTIYTPELRCTVWITIGKYGIIHTTYADKKNNFKKMRLDNSIEDFKDLMNNSLKGIVDIEDKFLQNILNFEKNNVDIHNILNRIDGDYEKYMKYQNVLQMINEDLQEFKLMPY